MSIFRRDASTTKKGLMAATDKSKLDNYPASPSYAPTSHVGAGAAEHALAVAGGDAGFLSGSDKQKLDNYPSTPQSGIKIAQIQDQKPNNTAAQLFTVNSWNTRDLTAEPFDPDGIVSLSGSSFTLVAGTYQVSWRAPTIWNGTYPAITYTRLNNTTDNIQYYGDQIRLGLVGDDHDSTFIACGTAMFTIAVPTTFIIEQYCGENIQRGGTAKNAGINEIYTVVDIIRAGS